MEDTGNSNMNYIVTDTMLLILYIVIIIKINFNKFNKFNIVNFQETYIFPIKKKREPIRITNVFLFWYENKT